MAAHSGVRPLGQLSNSSQTNPKPPAIVIFSQPDPKAAKDEPFVDIAPYVARNLTESGKYSPIVYKSNIQVVRDALATGALTPMDTSEPVQKEGAGHITRALGATQMLIISGRLTKEGVAGKVEMDQLVGQQNWTLMFSEFWLLTGGRAASRACSKARWHTRETSRSDWSAAQSGSGQRAYRVQPQE